MRERRKRLSEAYQSRLMKANSSSCELCELITSPEPGGLMPVGSVWIRGFEDRNRRCAARAGTARPSPGTALGETRRVIPGRQRVLGSACGPCLGRAALRLCLEVLDPVKLTVGGLRIVGTTVLFEMLPDFRSCPLSCPVP